MDRDRHDTIHEDVESAHFANRENINPETNHSLKQQDNATPNTCRKRTPLGMSRRSRHFRNSPQTKHSSPSATPDQSPQLLPVPSPRVLRNPFDEGGVTMSPRALEWQSGVATPSSVASGSGWTLEQRSALFPAVIEDHLVDSQYESPYTAKGLERSKLELESWLQSTDLTSPWSESKETSKSGKRVSLTSKRAPKQSDSTTQTALSLPVDFDLAGFLEKHGAPVNTQTSCLSVTVPRTSDSANSSLRRKLFDMPQVSDESEEEEDAGDFIPLSCLQPRTPPIPLTPQASEQFSSSPKKLSPVASSPGALSVCGGDVEASPVCTSPYRSPFRSPFGDPNLSLSPIPKLNIDDEDDDDTTPVKKQQQGARALRFSESLHHQKQTTSELNGTNDFDDSLPEENVKKTKSKSNLPTRAVAFSSMDHSFDVSMRSNEWGDVSAIQRQVGNTTSVMPPEEEPNMAESTRIQQLKKTEDDVYMASFSQESRGFSFCEVHDEVTKDGVDSGFASNPNSRTGSVLCEKANGAQIPQPVFPMIYEAKDNVNKED